MRATIAGATLVLALVACSPAGPPQAVVISGPLEETDLPLVITGAAVDSGLVCPAAVLDGRRFEDLAGRPLSDQDLIDLAQEAAEVRWFDEYTCTDGSGTFILRYEQLIDFATLDTTGVNEVARWTVESGIGAYERLAGEGVLVLDFRAEVAAHSGEVRANGRRP